MAKNQAATLEEMIQAAGGSSDLVESMKKQAAERVLVEHLLALRGVRGFSQEDIAKHFGCSQSKISKLESGTDQDLRIGDLISYGEAIGLELSVALSPKGATNIDRIKHHAFCIQDELQSMVGMVGDDESITHGVVSAHVEVLLNLAKIVAKSAENIPANPAHDGKRITIETRCTVAGTSAEPLVSSRPRSPATAVA